MPACNSAQTDTLYQLRPFLARLTANLSHCYNPNSKQAVEEARIKYKGVHFSQTVYATDIHQTSNEKVE